MTRAEPVWNTAQRTLLPMEVQGPIGFKADECHEVATGVCSLETPGPLGPTHRRADHDWCRGIADQLSLWHFLTRQFGELSQDFEQLWRFATNPKVHDAVTNQWRPPSGVVPEGEEVARRIQRLNGVFGRHSKMAVRVQFEAGVIDFADGRHRVCVARHMDLPVPNATVITRDEASLSEPERLRYGEDAMERGDAAAALRLVDPIAGGGPRGVLGDLIAAPALEQQGDWHNARRVYERALATAARLGDDGLRAGAVEALARACIRNGALDDGFAHLGNALRDSSPRVRGTAEWSLSRLVSAARREGDRAVHERALSTAEQSRSHNGPPPGGLSRVPAAPPGPTATPVPAPLSARASRRARAAAVMRGAIGQ